LDAIYYDELRQKHEKDTREVISFPAKPLIRITAVEKGLIRLPLIAMAGQEPVSAIGLYRNLFCTKMILGQGNLYCTLDLFHIMCKKGDAVRLLGF
jgi:hypothetical protein